MMQITEKFPYKCFSFWEEVIPESWILNSFCLKLYCETSFLRLDLVTKNMTGTTIH